MPAYEAQGVGITVEILHIAGKWLVHATHGPDLSMPDMFEKVEDRTEAIILINEEIVLAWQWSQYPDHDIARRQRYAFKPMAGS